MRLYASVVKHLTFHVGKWVYVIALIFIFYELLGVYPCFAV